MPLFREALLNSLLRGSSGAVIGARSCIRWTQLIQERRLRELAGTSVILRMTNQTAVVAALVALDGVARRIVLCTPDLASEKLAFIARETEADAMVVDDPCVCSPSIGLRCLHFDVEEVAGVSSAEPSLDGCLCAGGTEWILMTSGTTGTPKLVAHTLETLVGDWSTFHPSAGASVWSTFYDIRRYGGLQILLRAAFSGASLVLSDGKETVSDFVKRAAAWGVSHLSGTPSHWRRAMMCSGLTHLPLRYVRLSGEIADQGILNQLRAQWPEAAVVHAFASTEAGLAFEVADGLAGVPAQLIGEVGSVEVKVDDGVLCIRSPRNASRYLGQTAQPLKRPDGFVSTGDLLQRAGDRFVFTGRVDGVINVGGLKVAPEEVEAVLNSHPGVHASLVERKRSAVTGALVIAKVVPRWEGTSPVEPGTLTNSLLRLCREALPAYKVPAAITLVDTLPVTATGKLVRAHA